MIDQTCPIIVLDDVRKELWEISHGLGVCGLPIMPHLIIDGKLEREPEKQHDGVRILFTDLHVLGASQNKPEQYVSALVNFIRKLINPSTYLIVFWSAFPNEGEEAWQLLVARLKIAEAENLIPFGYKILDKAEVKNISDEDPAISAQATKEVKESISAIFSEFPQLKTLMQWESCASRAASATSNELIRKLNKGGIQFNDGAAVKNTLKRMSQEALGLPHAPNAPTKGLFQALTPIAQDWLNREAESGALDDFLDLKNTDETPLPLVQDGMPRIASLLNDFFIHSEQAGLRASERGAVIRLSEEFLTDKEAGLTNEIGLAAENGDWKTAICMEFAQKFASLPRPAQDEVRGKLDARNIYVVELSAECDYAQDKGRTHRFLLSLFVPSRDPKPFCSKGKAWKDALCITPEITIDGISGWLLISCGIYLTRPYKGSVNGTPITRMRQEFLSEISHHYSTHMRRPGKIAFF